MIINIRGTNGSGKTHLVRRLLAEHEHEVIYDQTGKKIVAYNLFNLNTFVVGRYDVACGGVDTMPKPKDMPDWNSMDVVEQEVRRYAKMGNVLFEGLIVSSVYGRWAKIAEEFPFTWAFLDTPMEVCRQRVGERNGGKLLKNEELGLEKTHLGLVYRRCQTHLRRAQAAGLNVLVVNYERAYETIQEQLLSA